MSDIGIKNVCLRVRSSLLNVRSILYRKQMLAYGVSSTKLKAIFYREITHFPRQKSI